MSWITNLFGGVEQTGKILDKAADGIYNGLDKLIYTDEEKADALAKGRELFMEFAKVANDQNSIRSVTRRWLAFSVVGPCMVFYTGSVVFRLFGMVEESNFTVQAANNIMPWAGGVLAFYFGPHLLKR